MNIRQDINGTTPQDLNKMNENFMNMWQKVYGNIDFADGNYNMKQRIMTQWIPVQGEGNLDSSYPLEIRFYIPPNVSKVKTSPFNVRCEHYRMDSGIAKGGGGVENVDIAMSMGNSNVAVSSVSSPQVAVSSNASVNANISTSLDSASETSCAGWWGNFNPNDPNNNAGRNVVMVRPTYLDFAKDNYSLSVYSHIARQNIEDRSPYGRLGGNMFTPVYFAWDSSNPDSIRGWVDLNTIQHRHDMSHTHTFRLNQSPHSHEIVLQPHSHDIALQPHTHSASGKITIQPHEHSLNEGIKVSTTQPQNLEVFINSIKVGNTLSGISSFSNVDISPYVLIGEWNVIKVSCSNLARVVIYGIIELVNKY